MSARLQWRVANNSNHYPMLAERLIAICDMCFNIYLTHVRINMYSTYIFHMCLTYKIYMSSAYMYVYPNNHVFVPVISDTWLFLRILQSILKTNIISCLMKTTSIFSLIHLQQRPTIVHLIWWNVHKILLQTDIQICYKFNNCYVNMQ